MILGAQATGDAIEVRVRGLGTGVAGDPVDMKSAVDQMAGNTVVAAGLRLGDVGAGWPSGLLGGMGIGLLGGAPSLPVGAPGASPRRSTTWTPG